MKTPFFKLPFQTYKAPSGQLCTLELKKIGGSWYGHLVELHDLPQVVMPPSPKVLAIDQGIINLAAGITTEGDTFLYTSFTILLSLISLGVLLLTLKRRKMPS